MTPKESSPAYIDEQRRSWEAHRTIGFAADYLSAAAAINRIELARDAAEFLNGLGSELPLPLLRLVYRCLGLPLNDLHTRHEPDHFATELDIHKEIHFARKRLKEEPRNAVLWVDVARKYETIGLRDHAARSMDIAIRLSPNCRFVLRSASRMYIHHDDVHRAHAILRTCPRTRFDPWLMAAEISSASICGQKSSLVGYARAMLSGTTHSPFHLSELASAVGTLELEDGNTKRGRRTLVASLHSPTENAIAQAAWASRCFGLGEIATFVGQAEYISAEARAWSRTGEVGEALASAREWLRLEPFSSRPAARGSYLASIAFEDYKEGVMLANRGLIANPRDFVLLNNKAVCLARQDKVDEASAVLSEIDASSLGDDQRIYFLATTGLLLMRGKQIDAGVWAYTSAIDLARRNHRRLDAAWARANLAMESAHARLPSAKQLAKAALDELDVKKMPEAARFVERLRAIAESTK